MTSFRESGKKHLLITGSRKSGKTTVLNAICKDIMPIDRYQENPLIGGIITYTVRDDSYIPKHVVLSDRNNTNITGMIAKRNSDASSLIPIPETFENLGTKILNQYNKSKSDYIVIDEIGYLEVNCLQYQKEIMRCFDKRVIAVIRKELNSFTEKLTQKQDVFLIDLDTIKQKYIIFMTF